MMITRFAPSPTGYLHLGHAFSALLAFEAAVAGGGRMLLRIEDIDPGRCRPEFETGIMEDLAWLGLSWPEPVRRQSERMADYRAALERLEEARLLYPCFCTRKEIAAEAARSGQAPHGPDGILYPGLCRTMDPGLRRERLAEGEPHALRLEMAAAVAQTGGAGRLSWHDREKGAVRAEPERFGDVILARKEMPTSYHLAVTLDDHLQGVTCVIRGEDLFPSTHVHRLLQALLGLETPDYRHHRLLTDEKGRRFAKRDRSLTLRSLREAGETPEGVRKRIGL